MATAPVGFVDVTMILKNDLGTRDCTWGYGIDPDGSAFETDVTGMAEVVYLAFTGDADLPYQPANILTHWPYEGVSCSFSTESGPIIDQHFETTSSSLSGESIPINCAILLKKNTASGGRRNRGRAFLPPTYPTEGNVDGVGNIFSTSLTNLETWYANAYDN